MWAAATGQPQTVLGGYFVNFLARTRNQHPEVIERRLLWTPPDGSSVEYSSGGDGNDFRPIRQGSPGQRAAAMLAFLLAHGEEPMLLDQPEDDLDNHLIYDLIVRQIRERKRKRQVFGVAHNANVVVNGDAEMAPALEFGGGQCYVKVERTLQDESLREDVPGEGGRPRGLLAPVAVAGRWGPRCSIA